MVGFFLFMEVKMKVWVLSDNSLNKSIPRKKKARLLKTSASKTYKPSRDVLWKRCSENKMTNKQTKQTNYTGLHKT